MPSWEVSTSPLPLLLRHRLLTFYHRDVCRVGLLFGTIIARQTAKRLVDRYLPGTTFRMAPRYESRDNDGEGGACSGNQEQARRRELRKAMERWGYSKKDLKRVTRRDIEVSGGVISILYRQSSSLRPFSTNSAASASATIPTWAALTRPSSSSRELSPELSPELWRVRPV